MSLEQHSPARAARHGAAVLRRVQVLARLGISNTSLYSWIRAGVLPAPFGLGEGFQAVFWLESDIDRLILARAAGEDAPAPAGRPKARARLAAATAYPEK